MLEGGARIDSTSHCNDVCVEGPSHFKAAFCKGTSAEAVAPWWIMKRAMAQAGNQSKQNRSTWSVEGTVDLSKLSQQRLLR